MNAENEITARPAPAGPSGPAGLDVAPSDNGPTAGRITWRAFWIGLLFAGFFAVTTVRVEWMWKLYTTTQIPVLPYFLLLLMVMAFNPLLRWLRKIPWVGLVRPFSPAELLIVFLMGMVSSGISTIGMASRLVPTIGGLFVKTWNTDQTRWDLYIEPYVNENCFISEPGIRQAAVDHRDADAQWRQTRSVYRAALNFKASREELDRSRARATQPAPTTVPAEAAAWKLQRSTEIGLTESAMENARKVWEKQGAGLKLDTVLAEYPAKVEALETKVKTLKARLNALEGRTDEAPGAAPQAFETDQQRRNMRAFQKVQEFRQGLPKSMRAIPGFLYDPGDSFTPAEGLASYRARLNRLVKGTAALADLRHAQILLDESPAPNPEVVSRALARLQAAMKTMEPIFNDEALTARHKELNGRLGAAQAEKAEKELELRKLHNLRYSADADRAERLEKQIAGVKTDLAGVDVRVKELQGELNSAITPQLRIVARARATYEGLGLADDQRAKARDLFAAAKAKADAATDPDAKVAIRQAAWEDLRNKVLTADQRKDLEAMPWLRDGTDPMARLEGLAGVVAALKNPALGAKEYQAARANLADRMKEFRSFDASWERFWIGDIDWSIWVKPLLTWSALILTLYLVFMAFNILIYKQWAHNENLIYPLAELPVALSGAEDGLPDGRLPSVFRSGLFWIGVLISGGVLAWNEYLIKYVPGVGNIPLMFKWADYVKGSPLEPLSDWNRLDVIFTLIGLTFLIPARISYSLWSFHGLYLLLTLAIVGLGYGVTEASFDLDWASTMNFRTALGAGALLVFAGVILHRVRRYIFCCVIPSAVSDMDAPERREMKVASWLFVAGSLLFILLLHYLLGANIFYSILYYVVLLVITIGMIRAVAEGGFLSFKCYFGPFHLIRTTVGMDKSWTAPGLLAPLFLFHAVLFTSYRVFIAPAMATALRVRDKLRLRRWSFHASLAAGILVAFAVGTLTHIIMSYDRGGDGMAGPTYSYFAEQPFGLLKTMSVTNPVDTAGGRWWMAAGIVLMAALLYFRRHVFWLPHPIGLIMLVNPMMTYYAFSIFVGWGCKSLVSKYGNKDVYRSFRNLFIGLIVGELLVKGISGQPLDAPWLWETP